PPCAARVSLRTVAPLLPTPTRRPRESHLGLLRLREPAAPPRASPRGTPSGPYPSCCGRPAHSSPASHRVPGEQVRQPCTPPLAALDRHSKPLRPGWARGRSARRSGRPTYFSDPGRGRRRRGYQRRRELGAPTLKRVGLPFVEFVHPDDIEPT